MKVDPIHFDNWKKHPITKEFMRWVYDELHKANQDLLNEGYITGKGAAERIQNRLGCRTVLYKILQLDCEDISFEDNSDGT